MSAASLQEVLREIVRERRELRAVEEKEAALSKAALERYAFRKLLEEILVRPITLDEIPEDLEITLPDGEILTYMAGQQCLWLTRRCAAEGCGRYVNGHPVKGRAGLGHRVAEGVRCEACAMQIPAGALRASADRDAELAGLAAELRDDVDAALERYELGERGNGPGVRLLAVIARALVEGLG